MRDWCSEICTTRAGPRTPPTELVAPFHLRVRASRTLAAAWKLKQLLKIRAHNRVRAGERHGASPFGTGGTGSALVSTIPQPRNPLKTSSAFAVCVFSLLGFACSAADPSLGNPEDSNSEAVGTTSEAVCSNYHGAAAVEASLAVATAMEMRRWNAPADFRWNATTGMLEVSPTGAARCPNGWCRNVQAVLSLQKAEAHGTIAFPGGDVLDAYTLRGVLKAHWDRQVNCNNWWGEYSTNGCWVEAHTLSFWKTAPGTCAVDNFFWADKPGTTTDLDVPQRLNYQLYFVGYPDNQYLNFRNYGSNVVIDPTIGLTEANTTSSGSCAATCSKYSTYSLSGQCCSCNGYMKTFNRSPFSADIYLCK